MTPILSVITVCFNVEKTIEKTIQSVLNQSFTNFEYIIIDGKSSDKTMEIVLEYEAKFKKKGIQFSWISEPDTGIYNAFNKGIKKANGNWISFLGSGDFYFENALKSYADEISKLSNEIDFIHSNVNLGNRKMINDQWSWKRFKRKMELAHVGAFHNANYFNKYGYFNESYKIAGDYEILLRAKQHLQTFWFEEVTVFMADGGISNQNIKKVYQETKRAKIETQSVSILIANLDYFWWILKYKIKKILHAIH